MRDVEIPRLLSSSDALKRAKGLALLSKELEEPWHSIPDATAESLVRILQVERDTPLLETLLQLLAQRFEWWEDSPGGPINVSLKNRVCACLPDLSTSIGGSERVSALFGEVFGRFSTYGELDHISDGVRETPAFKQGVLEGLARREASDTDVQMLLRVYAEDEDEAIRLEALDVIEALTD